MGTPAPEVGRKVEARPVERGAGEGAAGGPAAGGAPTGKKVYRYKNRIPKELALALKRELEERGFNISRYWDRDVEVSKELGEKYIYEYEVLEAYGGRIPMLVVCEGHESIAECRVFRVAEVARVELRKEEDVYTLLNTIDRVS
jgi:hypothetical protein